MNSITDIDRAQFGPITFAEPVSEHPYADIFSAAAQNQLVAGTDNLVAEPAAREQAYDARIKAIKARTGIELENPERGGYSIEARRAIRQAVIAGGMSPIDETGGIPAYQKRIFDEKVAELQAKHPDLTAGGINAEARAISHAAGDELGRAMGQPDLNPVLKYGAEFAGSFYGERRNPLFLGSLFAGPASAVGRTAVARIASSAFFQGLYNVGIAQAGKAATQEWQAKIGRDEGIWLSPQEIGLAFVMGAIPGAGIEAAKELYGPVRRLLSGRPEPGDLAKASETLGPAQPSAVAAARAGEESLAADAAALHGPAPEGVAPELHDDLVGAALKRADDPAAPSPEAVAAVSPPARSELVPATHEDMGLQKPSGLDDRVYKINRGGDTIGYANIRLEGDTADVRDIFSLGSTRTERGFIGTRDMLGLLQQFQEENPQITKLTGERVSGARRGGERGLLGSGVDVEVPLRPSRELQSRIEQAAPQTPADAMRAADEALDDFGRRDGMTALRERMQEARAAQDEATETWRASEDRQQRARSDVMNKIPMVRRDGTVSMVAERTVRSMGDAEKIAADTVRLCK